MADTTFEEKVVDEAALLALGSDARVEVVDGEIVEMSICGVLHHIVAGNFHFPLVEFVREHELGRVFAHGMLHTLKKNGQVIVSARVPDVSFIHRDMMPKELDRRLFFPIPPTLAVEVVSPDDDPEEIVRRVQDYLDAGTKHVLVMYPNAKQVYHYRPGSDTIRVYAKPEESPELDDILPGFRVSLAAIFEVPELEE